MSATAAMIARVRRMVNEPDDTTYDDDAIAEFIEAYPLLDSDGNEPDEEDWEATYDLNAAAADIWAEKAAVLAGDFDFSADGGNYSRSQAYEHAMQMSRYYRARRAICTIKALQWPPEKERQPVWIANLPEED